MTGGRCVCNNTCTNATTDVVVVLALHAYSVSNYYYNALNNAIILIIIASKMTILREGRPTCTIYTPHP